MTRLLLLVVISLATFIIVFHSQVIAFFSSGPASFTLLGVSLIVLAHQLRRRFNKSDSQTGHIIGH